MIMTKYFIGTLLTTLFGCSVSNANAVEPPLSFYSLKARTLEGEEFDFAQLKGKRVLIVNTASECGFTPQYKELQALFDEAGGEEFVILGFPSNDYGNQESGSESDIKAFCQKNYGVTFLMMAKVHTKGNEQHPVYQWLTQKEKNGAKNAMVLWNFQKFLINEKGQWLSSHISSVSPMSSTIRNFALGKQ
jgi:glutathione peroxidase